MSSAHSTRSHARLAPSAAHRWWVCPGSIRESEGIEQTSSRFADEGTAAHQLAQHCFDTGFDADRFTGQFIDVSAARFDILASKPDGDRVFEIDEEMAEGVQEYLDFVRDLANRDGVEVQTESYVDLGWLGIEELPGGTADFSGYDPETKTLDVVDFKYGRGVAVDPQDNKQLLCYALGVARRYSNRGLAQVRLTVVQPRCPHPKGPIRTWEVDVLDLFEFEDEIKERALATRDPDAPLVAGDHCKFCPAAFKCPELKRYALAIAQAEFVGDAMTLPVVHTLSSEQVAVLLKQIGVVEDWVKRVKEFAWTEATHGRCPPGWKLVAKRATRKWVDDVVARFGLMHEYGLDEDEITETKLRSPAQIEPMMPGKNKAARAEMLAEWVKKVSSGTTLAPEADKRPAVQVEAGAEFGEME